MINRAGKVERLAEFISRKPEPPEPVVGTMLWTPCSGMERKGTQLDHAGEICEAKKVDDRVEWCGTEQWTSFDEAQRTYPGIIRDTSYGLCPHCRTQG